MICTYRVRKGKQAAFLGLLTRHWPTLRRLKLVTAQRPVSYRGKDEAGGTVIVEIFTWRDGRAADAAHASPEVLRIWEPMQQLVEKRLGRPQWEFPHFQPLRLRLARV